MNANRALTASAVLMIGFGLAALVAPRAFLIGDSELLVSIVGFAALILALRTAALGRSAVIDRIGYEIAEAPDVEVPSPVPIPGEDMAAVFDQFSDRPLVFRSSRYEEGLEAAALAILSRYGHLTESEARERLAAGTWTDDPYAAAFLGDESVPSLPLSARIRTYLSDESFSRRSVRRTVDALVAVAGTTADSTGADDDPGLLERLERRLDALGDAPPGSKVLEPGSEGRADGPVRDTGHWEGISLVVLVAIGVGVLADQATVLLVAVVGIGYAAYARSNTLGTPALSVERTLDDERPDPDDHVEVTVTVTNVGSQTLSDLRLADGVPGSASVVDGSPRLGTTLRSGGSVTFSYAVAARRGVHEFEPLTAYVHDAPSTVEHELRVAADEPTSFTCLPGLEAAPVSIPLHDRSTRYTGPVDSDSGGEGAEFYATRDYRAGDPMNRVDWNRHARTGELATLLFREERNAAVQLVVDVHEDAFVTPRSHEVHAVDRSVEAAGTVFATMLDAGNRVGITALDHDDCWLGPGTGAVHRTRAHTLLGTHPGLTASAPDRRPDPFRWKNHLRYRLPTDSQLVIFSPLCGPSVVRRVYQLDAYGYPITIVSPDPTAGRTAGQRLARVARDIRITDLRRAGTPVVDWSWDEPLAVALARFSERRNR